MIKYFTLTDGVIELHEDRLCITDKAYRTRVSKLFSGFSLLLYGLFNIMRGVKEGDKEWLYYGLFITISIIILMYFDRNAFRPVQNEIKLTEIAEVSFKNRNKNMPVQAKILTHHNRERLIYLEEGDDNCMKFENDLRDLGIKIV